MHFRVFTIYECINEEDKKELSNLIYLNLSEPGILNILSKSYYKTMKRLY